MRVRLGDLKDKENSLILFLIFETFPKDQDNGQNFPDHFLPSYHLSHFTNIFQTSASGFSEHLAGGKVTTVSAETLLSDGRALETGSG